MGHSYRIPPTIFYPATEFTKNTDFYKNKFAINGVGKVDNKLYGKGNLNANISFYAWANHNQMALRRIMVDWREDGMQEKSTIFGEAYGFYMNAKPYCPVENDDVSSNYECIPNSVQLIFDYNNPDGKVSLADEDKFIGLTCVPSVGEQNNKTCPSDYKCVKAPATVAYGNQKVITCKEEPFNFVWNYTCDITNKDISDYNASTDIATPTSGKLSTKPYIYSVGEIANIFGSDWKLLLTQKGHPNNNTLLCVFKPRVQVLDNWGWCTGTCDDGGKDGCYEEYVNQQGITQSHCASEYVNSWLDYSDIVVVAQ